jgi:nitrogen fixation NifU-like protein
MGLDIYAENIIRHYENPQNKGKLANPSVSIHQDNPSCGDEIDIYLKIEDEKIKEIKFTGSGCSISMGTASILTEYLKGKSLKDVEEMSRKELLELIGIDPGPARMHCATLSLRAAKEAVSKYLNRPIDSNAKEL